MKKQSTMTSRQRMLNALEFNSPDKIPVVYHASPAGLHVHGQKLLDLFNQYPPDNPITFDSIPSPSPYTIDETGRYHEIRTDAWGTGWEYRIFGVLGHPITYPFENWEAASNYTFPIIPKSDYLDLTEQRNNFLIFGGGISIFERLHALQPFDQVLMDIYFRDPALLQFLDRLVEYWLQVISVLIDTGVDVIMFGDDWGTQHSSLISPDLFHTIFKPLYKRLMAPIHQAGCKVFFHSCGYLGGVFGDLIDLGIHGLWPQITLLESNSELLDQCRRHKVTLYIHPDRQYLIPQGSPDEIDSAIKHYAKRYHNWGGGGIFYVEIENDAPFENVRTLVEAIDKWR